MSIQNSFPKEMTTIFAQKRYIPPKMLITQNNINPNPPKKTTTKAHISYSPLKNLKTKPFISYLPLPEENNLQIAKL